MHRRAAPGGRIGGLGAGHEDRALARGELRQLAQGTAGGGERAVERPERAGGAVAGQGDLGREPALQGDAGCVDPRAAASKSTPKLAASASRSQPSAAPAASKGARGIIRASAAYCSKAASARRRGAPSRRRGRASISAAIASA